ncbi:MAG: hypothetical protein FWC56_05030, partial [Phycisphaerae bacterium]|nr:hypothetical protein [Phycisphaerae bacterium]
MPIRSIVFWWLAALMSLGGLILAHGFDQPIFANSDIVVRATMVIGVFFFVISRLLMLFPAAGLRDRLGRWWVDYVLIIAAVIWRILSAPSESIILQVGCVYVLLMGAIAITSAFFSSLTNTSDLYSSWNSSWRSSRRIIVSILMIALVLTILGGFVLTLPACQRLHRAVDAGHPLAGYQFCIGWLDSTFTAAAVLTGTGLAVQDIGYQYNRVGQLIILVLMQTGGLAVLSIGMVIGLHWRRWLGWASFNDDLSPRGLRRAITLVCVFTLAIELLGAVAIYPMWDSATDLNFATISQEKPLLGSIMDSTPLGQRYDEARIFASIFHSVSAFCNAGTTLTRDGYMAYRQQPAPYLALMPLMLLGGLGGPVIGELCKRMLRRRGVGLEAVSRDTLLTLCGTIFIWIAGAGLLYGIESSYSSQHRYPKANTPGRIILDVTENAVSSTDTAVSDELDFGAITAARAQTERINSMPTNQRMAAVAFQSQAAQTGGVRSVRLDEKSLSPASHLLMMGLMFIGGNIGGTAGGLRIGLAILLFSSLFTGRRIRSHTRQSIHGDQGDPSSDPSRNQ